MIQRRWIFAALIAISSSLLTVPAKAEMPRAEIEAVIKEYLASHPEELGRIVRDYLIKNPDVLRDVLAELIRKRQPATARTAPTNPEQKATIQSNAQLLFHSAHQMVLGNPNGSVTLVEFFDYNCGYCRRALADMLTLLRDDIDLRVVLKEFPILGSGSVEAARVSIAVRMQDAAGEKYLAFHRRLLSGRGQVDKSSALAVAREIGLDMQRLEQDLSSDEVTQTVEESAKLAGAIGINGTPGYVIGDAIIPGAVGVARLKESIALARIK